MEYEQAYNDLIARINAVKNTPKIGMKGKHHYDGYVETGIRDALDYIINPESEDERIRKFLIDILSHGTWRKEWPFEPNEVVAYLERQKEQKPSWTEIDKSRESVVFPFNARVKDSDKVVTIIDGQLNSDGKLWIRFASNEDDGFKVYNPEDLLVEQKPAEWSEEDTKKINGLFNAVILLRDLVHTGELKSTDRYKVENYYEELASWLKSLRPQPHWKPSEEQVSILAKVFAGCELNTPEKDSMVDLFNHLKDMI